MIEIDALMRAYDGDVPGASVLVVRDGRAVVRKAYGFANVEERIRATPDLLTHTSGLIDYQDVIPEALRMHKHGRTGTPLRMIPRDCY